MHKLSHNCVGKPGFDLVTQSITLGLERRNGDGFNSRWKLILGNRFVAFRKTGNEEKHQYKTRNS
jgi:hypothetical protein